MSNIPRKLGKLAPKQDHRNLLLAKYLNQDVLPAPPSTLVLSKGIGAWGMMLNNSIGDCAIAAPGHLIGLWEFLSTGVYKPPSDDQILATYEAISGFDLATGTNDNGCVEQDVVNYWKKTGIGSYDKIGAFATIEPGNILHIKQGMQIFNGLLVGFDLPETCQKQSIWHVPFGGTRGDGRPGSWGGHAVCLVDYNGVGPVCVTWGGLQQMTWGFMQTYMDEAYALLSQDFMSNGKSPEGFDLSQLTTDLGAI